MTRHCAIRCLITGLGVLSLAGCKATADDPAPTTTVSVPVKTVPLLRGDIPVVVSAPGQIEAIDKEVVLSPVNGVIRTLTVSEGSAVSVGDTLASIVTRESQMAIAGARTLIATATTPAQRAEAEKALQLAEDNAQIVPVTANRRGVVTSRQIVVGSRVSEGADLCSIVDPASIGFVAHIPDADMPAVKVGQPATIWLASLDSTAYRATVSAVSPESDPQSQTVRVRLQFVHISPKEERALRDGLLGHAQVETNRHTDVLLAPRSALLRNDETNEYSLVTITPDSLAHVLTVTLGAMDNNVAEVRNTNLRAGMPVIVEGQYALSDSTHVTVMPQDTP